MDGSDSENIARLQSDVKHVRSVQDEIKSELDDIRDTLDEINSGRIKDIEDTQEERGREFERFKKIVYRTFLSSGAVITFLLGILFVKYKAVEEIVLSLI